jgi:uncharacterized protein (DUF58 family)
MMPNEKKEQNKYIKKMNPIKNIFLATRFYLAFAAVIVVLAMSFAMSWLFPIGQTLLVLLFVLLMGDIFLLFDKKNKFEAQRLLPKVLSLSDQNKITIQIKNNALRDYDFSLIDEIPFQFQKRDFLLSASIKADETQLLHYELRPTARGEYVFGDIHLFIHSFIGFIERRITIPAVETVPVFPSVIQMKQYSFFAAENIMQQKGIKKLRKIGHSYEFEQVKDYVIGDDYRAINWKASSRKGDLMINQYTDERSQQIYCIIDKSRTMRMPFNNLTLMDYAINTTLTLSNIALQKQDKAGLISFSDKIGSVLKADSQTNQLHKIMYALYKEEERKTEANYEILYQISQKIIKGRSLVMLFTNFESQYAMENVLPTLRQINRSHLLIVVFFENTEIANFAAEAPTSVEGIYHQTMAKKHIQDKQQMANILKQYGIQTILTKPEDLSINTINKYLEMKARGLI